MSTKNGHACGHMACVRHTFAMCVNTFDSGTTTQRKWVQIFVTKKKKKSNWDM